MNKLMYVCTILGEKVEVALKTRLGTESDLFRIFITEESDTMYIVNNDDDIVLTVEANYAQASACLNVKEGLGE